VSVNVAQSPLSESSVPSPVPAPCGAGRGDGFGSPFLVKDGPNSKFPGAENASRPVWGKPERERYHRLQSILYYWEAHRYSIIRLDLTPAPGGDRHRLGPHFEELLRRISQREGRKVEYWRLTTREGLGVIHSLLAAPGERSLYVDFAWLSKQWRRIHGAPRVRVKRYQYGESSRKRVSRYLVSQYMAGQKASIRMAASWQTTFGFPVEPTWALFREGARVEGRRDALERWQGLLRGETVSPREGVSLNLGWLRGSRLRLKLKPGWGPEYPSSQREVVCG